MQFSRSTWACELKSLKMHEIKKPGKSRSTWACELKYKFGIPVYSVDSHAPRERVSWNVMTNFTSSDLCSHAPRERVSWNSFVVNLLGGDFSHAPRERVSWNLFKIIGQRKSSWSRSTWACELKYLKCKNKIPVVCHAPRERVSWNP